MFYVQCTLGYSPKKNYTVKDLVSYFKEIQAPFTTKQLYSTYSELPYELSLKYFFRNDTAFARYYYEIYNDEDQTLSRSGYKRKFILPRNYFLIKNNLFLIYKLGSGEKEDVETVLGAYNKNRKQIDSLVIYYKAASVPESYQTIKSKIYADSVIVFDYNLMYGEEYERGIKTTIYVTLYAIDTDSGKFVKIKTDEIKSKYDLYLFDEGKKEEVKIEDPYYKY